MKKTKKSKGYIQQRLDEMARKEKAQGKSLSHWMLSNTWPWVNPSTELLWNHDPSKVLGTVSVRKRKRHLILTFKFKDKKTRDHFLGKKKTNRT